jgi:hypothetical protein
MGFKKKKLFGAFELHLLRSAWKCSIKKKQFKNKKKTRWVGAFRMGSAQVRGRSGSFVFGFWRPSLSIVPRDSWLVTGRDPWPVARDWQLAAGST